MHKKINDRYFTIAVYALIVAVVSAAFGLVFLNLPAIFGFAVNTLVKLSAVFYAVLFALILLPTVRWLEGLFEKLFARRRVRPALITGCSLVVAYLLALILILITFGSIIPVLLRQLTQFADNFGNLLTALYTYVDNHFQSSELLHSLLISLLDHLFAGVELLSGMTPTLANQVFNILSAIASEVSSIFMGAILSIYLLACRQMLSGLGGKIVVALLPARSAVHLVVFFKRLYSDFCSFAGARIFSAFCFTAAVFVLSWVMNIPLFSIIALILLFSHLFPVAGPLIGDAIAVIMVLLLRTDMAFFFLLILIGLEIAGSKLLLPIMTPKKLRPAYGLAAALVLIGYAVGGFIGAFVALPLYTTLNVEFHNFLIRRLNKKDLPVSTEAYYDTDLSTLAAQEIAAKATRKAEEEAEKEKEDGGDSERQETERHRKED